MGARVFCVAFSASRRFFLLRITNIVPILKKKQFRNHCDKLQNNTVVSVEKNGLLKKASPNCRASLCVQKMENVQLRTYSLK